MNLKAPVPLGAWDRNNNNNKNRDRIDFCRQYRDHHLLESEALSTGIRCLRDCRQFAEATDVQFKSQFLTESTLGHKRI